MGEVCLVNGRGPKVFIQFGKCLKANYSDTIYERKVFNVFLNGKCKWIEGTHLLYDMKQAIHAI